MRIYSDLAPWFHLLTHTSDYEEEASYYTQVIDAAHAFSLEDAPAGQVTVTATVKRGTGETRNSRPVSLNLERGRLRPLPDGGRILVTEHPTAILRLSDPVARGREYRRLVNDLLMAVPHRRLAA